MILKRKHLFIGLISSMSLVFLGVGMSITPDLTEAYIEKKYTNNASKFMRIDDLKVHYRDEGQGMPIVLIHGTSSSLHTWEDWTKVLTQTHRVIRMDLPAFGLTGPNANHDYSMEYYASFLDQFLTKLAIDSLYLAGNSLGAQIAWYYTSHHLDQIKKLVLLDPAGFYDAEEIPFVFKLARIPLINQLVGKITPKYFIEKNLKEVYFDTEKITDSLIERYHDLTLRVGNRAAFIAKANEPMIDHTARLKLITTPTLILWGRNDHWIPVAHATRFSKDLPHSKVEIMEDTGHVPMEERPLESVAHTLQFLNTE
jgi:pimeloyl-ACP methyl ester carboxylesterase